MQALVAASVAQTPDLYIRQRLLYRCSKISLLCITWNLIVNISLLDCPVLVSTSQPNHFAATTSLPLILRLRGTIVNNHTMPVTLGRNLHFCFTKSKHPMPSQSSNIHENQEHHNMPFFNSLYEFTLECDIEEATIPDFSTVLASRRFFFSSPGNSNSIIDSSFMSSSIESTSSLLQQAEVDSEFELISSTFKVLTSKLILLLKLSIRNYLC